MLTMDELDLTMRVKENVGLTRSTDEWKTELIDNRRLKRFFLNYF